MGVSRRLLSWTEQGKLSQFSIQDFQMTLAPLKRPQLTSRSTNTVKETAPITFYRVPGTPTVIRPPRSSPKKT